MEQLSDWPKKSFSAKELVCDKTDGSTSKNFFINQACVCVCVCV